MSACVHLAQGNMSSFQQRNGNVYIIHLQPRDEDTDSAQRQTRRECTYTVNNSYSYSF